VKTRWRERERESDKKTKQNKTRLPKAVWIDARNQVHL
jgi:hypothetical protein